MSTADKLNKLLETKQAIKQAIINKGVEVADDTKFADYPSKISSIEDRYQEGYDCGSNDGYSNGWSDGWNQGYYEGGNGEGGGDPYYEDLYNQRTNNGTNISYLFNKCTASELNLSGLDTSSVTDIQSLFSGCDKLTSLDVSHFITNNVTNMYYVFQGCYSLTSLDLSNFNTSKVTNMGYMLAYCNNLTTVNLSSFNTSNVTSMSYMFSGSKSLIELDLSNFDTSNVTSLGSMFSGCNNLTTLDISNFDLIKATNANYILKDCTSLQDLRLDNCNADTISKIITSKNFPTNAIDGVTRTIYCKEENAAGLTPPENWVFSYVTEEEPVDPPAGDIPLYVSGEFRGNTELTEVRTMVTSEHDNLDSMFAMCENLVSVNTQDWDTSNVYEMYYMFAHCKSLTALNLSNWVTDKVTRMAEMFMLCWNLTELDLSNFNTSNVTSVAWMFYNCQRLESLDLSNFDLTNLTGDANNPMGTENMFDSCYALTTLRLDNCSYDTITKIINSTGFPASNYGTIYCKAANQPNTLPEGFNWTFNYID